MRSPTDGDAVSLARELLRDGAVAETVPWRSTVVPRDGGGWTVRTWTQTPASALRPVGTPNYVHAVVPDADGGLRPEQVYP